MDSKLEELNESLHIQLIECKTRLDESQSITNIGSWSWDIKSNTVKWSDGMYILLGLAVNSQSPDYALALKHVHDDDKVNYEKELKNALDKKGDYYFENKISKEDNSVISVISRGKCFCDEQGDLTRMIGTVQDVTQIKHLLSRNERLESYSNTLSHDIKAPVKNIVSYISLLKTKLYNDAAPKVKEYIDTIQDLAVELDNKISKLHKKAKT